MSLQTSSDLSPLPMSLSIHSAGTLARYYLGPLAPANGGLWWLSGDQHGNVTQADLGNDVIYTIAAGQYGLWIRRQRGGLTHLESKSGTINAKTYTTAEGLRKTTFTRSARAATGLFGLEL
jgi:hypothetical protein